MKKKTLNTDKAEAERMKQEFLDLINEYKQNPDKYLPILDEKIIATPDALMLRQMRAEIKSENPEMLEEAINDWSELIDIQPADLDYFLYRGTCHELLGNHTLALKDFLKAYDPKVDNSATVSLVRSLIQNKQYDKAAEIYHEHRDTEYDRIVKDLFDLAYYFSNHKKSEEALSILQAIQYCEIPADASISVFDITESIEEVIKDVEELKLNRYLNKIFKDPIALEKFFWRLLKNDRTRANQKDLINIAKIIFYKRILDIEKFIDDDSPHPIKTLPEKYRWEHILKDDTFEKLGGVVQLRSDIRGSNRRLLWGICVKETSLSQAELSRVLDELSYKFTESNISVSVFGSAFNSFLSNWGEYSPRDLGQYTTTKELRPVIWSLLGIGESESIFDPAAGLGSLLLDDLSHTSKLSPNRIIGGYEINEHTHQLLQMNAILNGNFNSRFECEDALLAQKYSMQEYDYAICEPPFRKKSSNIVSTADIDPKDRIIAPGEFAFLEKMLTSLKDNGRFAIILSIGLLTRSGMARKYRQYLIEKDYVDIVFGLPESVHHYTNIKTAIIFGTKRAKPRSTNNMSVEFFNIIEMDRFRKIDFKNFISDDNRRDLDYVKYSRFSLSLLEGLNFSLDPRLWILDSTSRELERKHRPYEKLQSINKIIESYQSGINYKREDLSSGGEYALIRITELSSDSFSNELDLAAIATGEGKSGNRKPLRIKDVGTKHLLKKDCVLIALKGLDLKPTIFRFEGTPIVIANGVFALFPNKGRISLDYLANELNTEIVKQQAQLYRSGITIPSLKHKDVLGLNIEVPNLNEQAARLRRFQDFYINEKLQSDKGFEAAIHKAEKNFYNSLSLIRHQLANVIGAATTNHEALRTFIEINHPDILKESVTTLDGHPLVHEEDQVKFVMRDIESSFAEFNSEMEMIQIITKGISRGIKKKLFPIKRVLESIIERFSEDGISINIPNRNYSIYADPDFILIALKQIVANAIRHGKRKDEILEINFQVNPEIEFNYAHYFQLICRNNGNPIPDNFSLEELSQIGESAGSNANSGMGGFVISQVVDLHGGLIMKFGNIAGGLVEMEILFPRREE
jgi:type I restriction enzyme M protein